MIENKTDIVIKEYKEEVNGISYDIKGWFRKGEDIPFAELSKPTVVKGK